jgi:hypothetical protein
MMISPASRVKLDSPLNLEAHPKFRPQPRDDQHCFDRLICYVSSTSMAQLIAQWV